MKLTWERLRSERRRRELVELHGPCPAPLCDMWLGHWAEHFRYSPPPEQAR